MDVFSVPQVRPPGTSLAAEGSFNQPVKHVQQMAKDLVCGQISELTAYLATPENRFRWFASDSQARVATRVLSRLSNHCSKNIREETQQEAISIPSLIASNDQEGTSTQDCANEIFSMNCADQVEE